MFLLKRNPIHLIAKLGRFLFIVQKGVVNFKFQNDLDFFKGKPDRTGQSGKIARYDKNVYRLIQFHTDVFFEVLSCGISFHTPNLLSLEVINNRPDGIGVLLAVILA